MAGQRRGAGPLWALGGVALGVCLAGVAGQLVEVRRGGARGLGRLWPRGRGLGTPFCLGSCLFPFLLPSGTWINGVTQPSPEGFQAPGGRLSPQS